jgi:ADP-heptose:LPS heptosyltransferase
VNSTYPFNPSGLKKILVIQTASIGDVILATPVVEKLHRFYPETAIDLLVKKGNEPLFAGHPYLHAVLVWDKSRKKFSNLHDLAHRIRKSKYDLIVNIQRFASTGLVTAFSGATMRIGFDKNPFSFFYTKKIKHRIGTGMHEVERNLELIRDLTDGSFAGPRLYPTDDPSPSPLPLRGGVGASYTISPASLWFTKQYPKEKWIELIRLIPQEATIYLLGSTTDLGLCDEITRDAGHPGLVSLAGKLSFLESAALMKRAKMNFTNDSAPMHLASSVDAPVTVIYCSTVPGFGFGPLSPDSCVVEIETPLPCRPCGLHGHMACPEKHFRCAIGIPVNRLTARV